MGQNMESVLDAARRLPLAEQRRLAARLLEDVGRNEAADAELAANLAIVERTRGTIKGVDRETIIRIANDEEFCGY